MTRLVGISLLIAVLGTVEGHRHGGYYCCSSIGESLEVSGNVFVQGEMGYEMAQTTASGAFPENIAPSVIVEAMSEEDVQAAVLYAGECGYTVSSRSAGHAYVGSSSCNSENGACMQIDVSNLNHTVVEGDLLMAGPGMTLRQMADLCLANEFHIPSGECAGVTLGGHFQTGGFGVWGRPLGPMAARVEGFRIVLADGTIMDVVRPVAYETSQMNDDLYWAVLGGSAGSWGVITQVTIKPRKDADYFSAYGTTTFLFEEEGVVGLYRRFAEIANTYPDDKRWTIVINSFNLPEVRVVSVETAWVAPLEEAGDYDPALFESLLGACVGCIPLISAPPVVEPLSFSLRFKYVKELTISGFPAYPFYRVSLSQTPTFITPDQGEMLARKIAAELPPASFGGEGAFELVTQFGTPMAPLEDSDDRALPWPDDVMGVSTFYSAPPALIPRIVEERDAFASFAINDLFGGVDHRMYWSPYLEFEMPGAAPLYFETEEKFNRLMDIKGCVDPDGLFSNLMSIPVPAKSKGCKGGKAKKGMKAMKGMAKKGMKEKKGGKEKKMKGMAKKAMKGMKGMADSGDGY